MSEQRCSVVTGSSKGWGRAIAEGLAAAGDCVVLNGLSDEVDVVVREIRNAGGEAIGVRVGTDTPDGVEQLLRAALDAYGRVDIWANSLGIQNPQPLLSLELATWEAILRLQLTAMFLGTQAAARQMVKQGKGGRIINVVGGGAYGIPGASAHSASKGGALSATISWAEELRPHGITVNAIRGGVQSPGMRDYVAGTDRFDERYTSGDLEVLRELGFYRRDEAAPLPVWLASESASDVSGFHIAIDGTRVMVYDRVSVALELYDDDGWTTEKLEATLHPALRALPPQSEAASQRRPPSGRIPTFDDRDPPNAG
jgi:3-oxoacyl-[acyl-carrier protein] reductase